MANYSYKYENVKFLENGVFKKCLWIVQNIKIIRLIKTRIFNDPSNKVSYENRTYWDILHSIEL